LPLGLSPVVLALGQASGKGGGEAPAATELKRTVIPGAEEEKVKFGIPLGGPKAKKAKLTGAFGEDEDEEEDAAGGGGGGSSSGVGGSSSGGGSSGSGKAKVSGIEALMKQEQRRKEEEAKRKDASASARTDYWLATGIIVKVLNRKLLDGKYYKAKGVVEKVVDKYTAHLRLNQDGVLIKIDQEDVETVVPQIGGSVLILNGRCRGSSATLLAIDERNFNVSVKVEGGQHAGRVLEAVEYEDISKLAPSS